MKRATSLLGATLLAAFAGTPAAHAAPAAYDGQTVIVKYAAGSSSSQRSLAGRLAGVVGRVASVRGVGAQVVRVSGDPAAAARRLNRSRAVLYAEPNYTFRATAVPNDPRFGELYGLHNTGQTGGRPDADIDAPEGWDAPGLSGFPATGGAKIGIVDTGVMSAHEDLAGKVVDCAGVRSFGVSLLLAALFSDPTIESGRCADDNGHGTHVAGTAAAVANNGRGVAGVAFDSPLAICKALDSLGSGPVAGIANCIDYLVGAGAKVISMSLGSSSDSRTLREAVQRAAPSALLVAAAGNDGDSRASYPASYPGVVSVAATDKNDARASFSNANAAVEVAAPGVGILSTWSDGGYRSLSGTSMATPHAAGVAAVIAGRTAGGPAAWRAKLDASVDDLGAPGRDTAFGFGRVNLQAATG